MDACRITLAEGHICQAHASVNSYKMLTSVFLEATWAFEIMPIVYKHRTPVFVTVQCPSFGGTQRHQPPLSLCGVHSSDVKVLLAGDDQLQARGVAWVDCDMGATLMLTARQKRNHMVIC